MDPVGQSRPKRLRYHAPNWFPDQTLLSTQAITCNWQALEDRSREKKKRPQHRLELTTDDTMNKRTHFNDLIAQHYQQQDIQMSQNTTTSMQDNLPLIDQATSLIQRQPNHPPIVGLIRAILDDDDANTLHPQSAHTFYDSPPPRFTAPPALPPFSPGPSSTDDPPILPTATHLCTDGLAAGVAHSFRTTITADGSPFGASLGESSAMFSKLKPRMAALSPLQRIGKKA
jgi:hypothetical protein